MKKLDFHVHVTCPLTAEESAAHFRDMCKRHGYEGVCILASPHNSLGDHPNCNEFAMAVKALVPNSYAFGSIHPNGKDYVEQAKELMARGFQGIKLLNGKPSEYRYYGFGLEDPRFDRFFAYAEEAQIPLDIHNNDPLKNWDVTKATPRAIERGWVYDDTLPSQAWFFAVMENILAKYPRLRLALAHMGFYYTDLSHLTDLMERYPNLYMDITPALDIYDELSKTPAEAERFFRKYHKRIIYGTDAQNDLTGFAYDYNNTKDAVVAAYLAGGEPCVIDGHAVTPIHLEPEMLENIYYHNAMRFMSV